MNPCHPKARGSLLLLAALFMGASSGAQGVDPERVYPLTNASFETTVGGNPLHGWGISVTPASDTASGVAASTVVKLDGNKSAKVTLANATTLCTLWNSMPITAPDPDVGLMTATRFGEKVSYGVWVYLDSATVHGTITANISCNVGVGNTIIATAQFPTSLLPVGEWIYLQPSPVAGAVPGDGGRPVAGTTLLTFGLKFSGFQGALYVDYLRGGRFDRLEYPLANQSFDASSSGSPTSWSKVGLVSSSSLADEMSNPSYYGQRHAILTAVTSGGQVQPALIRQTIPVNKDASSPKHGDIPEASVWVKFIPGVDGSAALTIQGMNSAGAVFSLGQATVGTSYGAWKFLKVTGSPIPASHANKAVTSLRLQVSSTHAGGLWVDFAQVGQRFATNGNPRKYILSDIEPYYRSREPGDDAKLAAIGSVGDEKMWIYRNWILARVLQPASCRISGVTYPQWGCTDDEDPDFWNHDPGIDPTVCDRRLNGRRDLALSIDNPVSIVGGAVNSGGFDDLPLIGGYDTSSEDVIRWQIQMAMAAGVDAFSIEAQGHASAAETWHYTMYSGAYKIQYPFGLDAAGANWWAADDNYTPSPVNTPIPWTPVGLNPLDQGHPFAAHSELSMEAMWDVADQTDFKLFPFYGLSSIAGANWVGATTFEQQKEIVRYDLARFAQFYFDRKATLKINGAMPIGIFDYGTILMDGNNTQTSSFWSDVIADVNSLLPGGRKIMILGSRPPSDVANFNYLAGGHWNALGGMLPWYFLASTGATAQLHKYAGFAEFASGNPIPAAGTDWTGLAVAAANDNAMRVDQWAAQDEARLRIGSAFTDFDDSGVPGWASNDRCVRIMSEHVTDMLGKTFDANLALGFDWVMVATWNGWTEFTTHEPFFDLDYWNAAHAPGFDENVDPSTYLGAAAYQRIFGRVLALQGEISAFKGISQDPTQFHKLTGALLESGDVDEFND